MKRLTFRIGTSLAQHYGPDKLRHLPFGIQGYNESPATNHLHDTGSKYVLPQRITCRKTYHHDGGVRPIGLETVRCNPIRT